MAFICCGAFFIFSLFLLLFSLKLIISYFSAEIGDFDEGQCRSHLLNNKYIPDQMPLIDKIMEFHSMNV